MSDISQIISSEFPQFVELLTKQGYILVVPENKILKDCNLDH